jgi:hypothetical protein
MLAEVTPQHAEAVFVDPPGITQPVQPRTHA